MDPETIKRHLSATGRYLRHLSCAAPPENVPPGAVKADFHIHPTISGRDALVSTIDRMHRRGLQLMALTVHWPGSRLERDYWAVKSMAAEILGPLDFRDAGPFFKWSWKGLQFAVTSGYECYCRLPGVAGRLCLIVIGADSEWRGFTHADMNFRDHVALADRYKAILIASHPYTLWAPHGPMGVLRYRLADVSERAVLKQKVFPMVDCIDMVASNIAWMVASNELAAAEFGRRPLANSDIHAVTCAIGRKIGRTYNAFEGISFENADAFRDSLRENIRAGTFTSRLQYMGPIDFVRGVALASYSDHHP